AERGGAQGAEGGGGGGGGGQGGQGKGDGGGRAGGGADSQAEQNPRIVVNVAPQQRANHRQQHSQLADDHSTPRRGGMIHPFDGEDESCGSQEINERENAFHYLCSPPAPGSRLRNIFSMRSVIR